MRPGMHEAGLMAKQNRVFMQPYARRPESIRKKRDFMHAYAVLIPFRGTGKISHACLSQTDCTEMGLKNSHFMRPYYAWQEATGWGDTPDQQKSNSIFMHPYADSGPKLISWMGT